MTWDRGETDPFDRFQRAFDAADLRIVEVEGAPVGTLAGHAGGTPRRLMPIAITPSHQRCGLGAALTQCLIDDAAGAPVWLQVLRLNPARALYERPGSVVIGETPAHRQLLRTPARLRDATSSALACPRAAPASAECASVHSAPADIGSTAPCARAMGLYLHGATGGADGLVQQHHASIRSAGRPRAGDGGTCSDCSAGTARRHAGPSR